MDYLTANLSLNKSLFQMLGNALLRLFTAATLSARLATSASAAAQEPIILNGHTGWVHAVAFAPDGKILATASADRTVRLWNTRTGETKGILEGHLHRVRALAFSRNGKALASGAAEFHDDEFVGEVRLWDARTMELKQSWSLKSNDVHALSFSSDSKLLASGGLKGISLWDVSAGELQRTLPTGDSATLALTFSPDGRSLASGSFDTQLRLWDTQTWEIKRIFESQPSEVRAVVFAADGKTIASYSGGRKQAFLWDAETGKLKHTFLVEQSVSAVALAPDGQTLAIGSGEGLESSKGRVELWDAASGERTRILSGHNGPVTALAFSPDGKTLASGSQDATAKLWDVAKALRSKPLDRQQTKP
ncbi:MAG: repeat-containing protein [Verrucomicrobiales bacterium]|nr:repeat-containing protein [Verrucomicrobiales bacterium]